MTKLTHKSKHKIEPSSRDSISSWLDVLTSMLAVSESQRDQVRDELEDHLRSRVDDLLIVGKPEPEAIQIAVAELGETAELAKLITHAHTRINPRRKLMNTALIAVALGGMSFGGFTLFTGTGAPSATPNNGGAVPVVMPEETRAESQPNEKMVELSIENMPMLMAFDQIANAFGYTADIHSLNSSIVSNLQRRKASVVGKFTLDRAIQILKMQSLRYAAELATEVQGDVIELLTHEEVVRRETSVKTYSIGWSNFENAENVANTLQVVVGGGQYAQFFKMSFVADQLVIDARPEAHEQVEEILSKARLAYEALQLKEETQRAYTIARIKDEYERVQSELVAATRERGIAWTARTQLSSRLKQARDEQDEVREEIEIEIAKHEQRKNELQYRIDELEMRHARLMKLLIDSEYKELFNFSEDSPQDQQPAFGRPTATISGDGLRSGKYEVFPGLTLSRFIAAAGGLDTPPNAQVSLKRLGSLRELGTLREVVSGELSDIVVFEGDEIIISAADD